MIPKRIWFSVFVIVILTACTSDPLDVDASHIKVNIGFVDVQSALMESDSASLLDQHRGFKSSIKDIYDYEIGFCLRIGDVEDTAFYNSIVEFRKDPSIQKIAQSITYTFTDLKIREANIEKGFQHLNYHFPEGKVPANVVYLNSLFRSGVFCTENEIGIGLEMFLGQENEVIRQLNPQVYFDWMKEAMDEQFLERDVLAGWISTHYVDEVDGNLAGHLVRWGKILYLTEAAFPDDPEHTILRYSKADYDWALENEFAFWEYLVNEKLLFKINERTTMNMIGEGPFTPGLPEQESPDRLGQFIGWRMVHSYMDKMDCSLEELVDLPYNEILQEYEIE